MRAASTCIYPLICWATACEFPRPADVPDVVLDAGADAAPDVAIPFSCTPNEFIACEENTARLCNSIGDSTVMQDCGASGCNADARRCNQCVPNAASCSTTGNELDHCGSDGLPGGQEACALGCVAGTAAHCAYLEPRYLPDVCDAPAAIASSTVSNLANLDTSLDSACTGGIILQDGGPPICVVRYGSFQIAPSGTLNVFGVRALALVTDRALSIEGVLDVSGRVGGPGGGTVVSGERVGTNGGGGAGFATAGGAGGSATQDGGGGLGGGKATDPSIVTVLVGGTRPSSGLSGAPAAGRAGGAVTLIGCRGQVAVSGVIDAGGSGGAGGGFGNTMFAVFGGAGGGSGGNVVLQGLSIIVTGEMFANGGGGGAGFVQGGPRGQPGGDGTRSTTIPAPGGVSSSGEGAGGTGGLTGAVPGPGLHPTVANATPGGGGGSIGFFQTYTPMNVSPTLTPSAASPAFGPNKIVRTR